MSNTYVIGCGRGVSSLPSLSVKSYDPDNFVVRVDGEMTEEDEERVISELRDTRLPFLFFAYRPDYDCRIYHKGLTPFVREFKSLSIGRESFEKYFFNDWLRRARVAARCLSVCEGLSKYDHARAFEESLAYLLSMAEFHKLSEFVWVTATYAEIVDSYEESSWFSSEEGVLWISSALDTKVVLFDSGSVRASMKAALYRLKNRVSESLAQ